MMNYPLLAHIDEISPRPILFVVGDRAHSKFFSENAYDAALEPKELYEMADAEHIDLYDRTDRIPLREAGGVLQKMDVKWENRICRRSRRCLSERTRRLFPIHSPNLHNK